MIVQRTTLLLATVLAATAILLVYAAVSANYPLARMAGRATLAAVLAALWIGRHGHSRSGDDRAIAEARATACTLALVYLWGAAVMIGIGRLQALKWYHYGQYGSLMAIIGAGILCYAHLLGRRRSALRARAWLDAMRWAALAQGVGAIAGITWLVVSGKAASPGGDWGANIVFIAGGLAVAAASAASARRLIRS